MNYKWEYITLRKRMLIFTVLNYPNGSVKKNVVPIPSPERTQMRPPIRSTNIRETVSPNPVPCAKLLILPKRSKIFATRLAGIPIPVSFT